MSRSVTPLAAWAVLLLAAVLRGWGLGGWSLDGDEVYSFFDARAVLAGESWPHGMVTHPLGYLMMSASAFVLGLHELALRLPAALCGLGAVAALLFLRRDVLDRRTACLAGLLAATSPWLVYHAQTARFYGPQLLAASLATLWALPGSGRRPLAAMLAWVAAVLCHPSALLLGPAVVLALVQARWSWRQLAGLAGLGAVGLGGMVLADDGALILVVRRVVEHIDPNRYDVGHLVMGLGYNLGPAVGLAALAGWWAARPARTLVLAAAAALPLAVLLGVALLGPSAHQRYAMAAVPAWMLLAGGGLAAIRERRRALGGVAVLVALAIPAPALLAHLADGNRHDLRGVADWFLARATPDDAFIADEHGLLWHYLQREAGFADALVIEDTEVHARQRHTLLRSGRECWVALKVSRLGGGVYDPELVAWVDAHFEEVAVIGAEPPPLVRHDNRYRLFRRVERLPPAPFVEAPGDASEGRPPR